MTARAALVFALTLIAGSSASASAPATTIQIANNMVVDGIDPSIVIDGLPSGREVRVHALRTLDKWQQGRDGAWARLPSTVHAWGDFVADSEGRIALATAQPLRGTYDDPDPLGLIWSGKLSQPLPNGLAPDLMSSNTLKLAVYDGSRLLASLDIALVAARNGLTNMRVHESGLDGYFAAPAGRKNPVVIVLHGSEGGSPAKAEAEARRFAARGFAALALNYFTQPYEAIDGVPTDLANIAVEQIDRARGWLARRPEADVKGIGLYGTSKGAELALVAAATYRWIDAVVACVPSDIVWEGGGAQSKTGPRPSSWRVAGKPVPFVRLLPFDAKTNKWKTNSERYLESRAIYARDVPAATIKVNRSRASFLLLSGGRDEVWASAAMSRAIAAKLPKGRAKVIDHPLAGHQICGTGQFPPYLYGRDRTEVWASSPRAEGTAAAANWRTTVDFLWAALK